MIDLTAYQQVWDETEVKQKEYSQVPDGTYSVMVYDVTLTESRTSGTPMVSWDMKIVAGEHQNRHVFKKNMIKTEDNIKCLKQDIYAAGLHLEKITDLPQALPELIGVHLEVVKKTKNDFENVFINKAIQLDDERMQDNPNSF